MWTTDEIVGMSSTTAITRAHHRVISGDDVSYGMTDYFAGAARFQARNMVMENVQCFVSRRSLSTGHASSSIHPSTIHHLEWESYIHLLYSNDSKTKFHPNTHPLVEVETLNILEIIGV
jgi:hypothetical protein